MEQVSSLKTGVKYKDTPIGKIPVDWEAVTLSQIAEINMGQSPPSKDCNEQGDGLPFYQGNAEFGSKYPSPQKWCKRPKKLADEGDILISVRAPVGEINIAPHKCCIGRGIAAVQAKDIHDKFLYQSMLLYRKNLQKMAQGSTFEAINRKELAELLTLLPPFPEQEKIADILTTVDKAIEKTTQFIEKTKELKKGLMQSLLTRGIEHNKFKKTEIGEIPDEWEVVPLSKTLIGHKSRYGVYKERRLYGEGTQILKIGDVFQKDFYSGEKAQRLMLSEKELISNEVFPNDILMAVASVKLEGVGEAMYVLRLNEKTAFDHNLANIRTDHNKCNPKFLFYTLKSRIIRKRVESLCTKVGTTFLKASEIDKFLIPVPPLNEQHQIAEILFELDAQIEKESNHKEQLETLKKGLMQVLLTGKLRVAV